MVSIITSSPAQSEKSINEPVKFKIIKVKRYKLIELATLYEVDRRTFRGWLDKFKEELGKRDGHYYTIPQVKLIFSRLELPSYLKVELTD